MGNSPSTMSPITTEEQATAIFAPIQHRVLSCMFVPIVFDLTLLGVFVMQVYTYFAYQTKDSWWTRGPVITVVILQLVSSGYNTYIVQWLFVENFGLWAPFFVTKVLAWAPFIASLNSFVVQCFMSYRAYRLNKRAIWIPITVLCLTLVAVGSALCVLIMFYNLNSLVDSARVFVPYLMWLTAIMLADLTITSAIVYGLSKSKTGWSKTDKRISKLIRMTIEGQMAPLIMASIHMIEYIIEPPNLLGATLQNMQPKFYAVGMMYSINARISFQRNLIAERSQNSGQVFAFNSRLRDPTQIQVAVETETQTYTEQPQITGPYSRSRVEGGGGGGDDKQKEDSIDENKDQNQVFNSTSHLTYYQTQKQ